MKHSTHTRQRSWRRLLRALPAAALVAAFGLAAVPQTDAGSYYRYGSGFGLRASSFGYGYGFGFRTLGPRYYRGFGPSYYRGYHGAAKPGLSFAQARAAGIGALDLSVRPKADVYVDGELVGRSTQFDGSPDFLWLEEGVHEVTFVREGRATIGQAIEVSPGELQKVKVRLERGESIPPAEVDDGA